MKLIPLLPQPNSHASWNLYIIETDLPVFCCGIERLHTKQMWGCVHDIVEAAR